KDLLSSRIPFFRALFNSNMLECVKREINLSSQFCEFDFSTFENLVEYAYTGCLTISVSNVQDIMMGASYLQIASVMDECSEFMISRMRIDNVLSIFSFFELIVYHEYDAPLLNFIDTNLIPISFTDDFLDLPVDNLITFIQRDSLYVDNESQVFEIINRWI
ncbi:hypothetical protein PENTCL1PPCAC_10527, partial [Pristionchus entomophagus]